MSHLTLGSLVGVTTTVLAAVVALAPLCAAQAPAAITKATPAIRTAWGSPDLQGIWTDEYQTPLQRPAQYMGREFLTEAEVAALDRQRAGLLRQDDRGRAGTEGDVAGAYNAVFVSVKRSSRRTSLVVDPPDGRIPPSTPEFEKKRAVFEAFRLALMQATQTCKEQLVTCRGGKFGPASSRRAEAPPSYNTERLNRSDGPEDRSMAERCMAAVLPDFTGYRRIVQSPDVITIFYDVGQGQGWQRVIPITSTPHLPASIRPWWGDSRGRWEGATLVVDVSNFSPKEDFRGSRENRHLIERWTRTGPGTLKYVVTVEDPTVWTKPWTVKQEYSKQNDQANRIYYEPRCSDTNFGLAGMLANSRAEEKDFADGRGPDPATRDNASGGPTFFQEENADPFEQ